MCHYFKYTVMMVCLIVAVGCTEDQDQTLLVVRSEMLTQLNEVTAVCESTPDSAIRGSDCINKMNMLSNRIDLYLTPQTSQVIGPVVVGLDDLSKSVYDRWVSFENSTNPRASID